MRSCVGESVAIRAAGDAGAGYRVDWSMESCECLQRGEEDKARRGETRGQGFAEQAGAGKKSSPAA
eukprot:4418342-Pleurochrysis_carterae.AAC.1